MNIFHFNLSSSSLLFHSYATKNSVFQILSPIMVHLLFHFYLFLFSFRVEHGCVSSISQLFLLGLTCLLTPITCIRPFLMRKMFRLNRNLLNSVSCHIIVLYKKNYVVLVATLRGSLFVSSIFPEPMSTTIQEVTASPTNSTIDLLYSNPSIKPVNRQSHIPPSQDCFLAF